MSFTRLDWYYTGSAAGALSVAAVVLFLRTRWRRDPDEIERRRRERVSRIGRIAHADIMDLLETEAAPPPRRGLRFILLARSSPPTLRRVLVVYRYMVSGVAYETAQDLTAFTASTRLAAVRQVASVKYDPANPSNSILVADTWSGLRNHTSGADDPRKGQ